MATSYSTYPVVLDGYSTLPLRRDGIDEIVAADVNRLRDAIYQRMREYLKPHLADEKMYISMEAEQSQSSESAEEPASI